MKNEIIDNMFDYFCIPCISSEVFNAENHNDNNSNNGFSFDELATEIYALTFGMLVSDVFNKLCSMDDSLK